MFEYPERARFLRRSTHANHQRSCSHACGPTPIGSRILDGVSVKPSQPVTPPDRVLTGWLFEIKAMSDLFGRCDQVRERRTAWARKNSTAFGRAAASQPAPKGIYNPRRSLNGISVLSKFCDGRSFNREKAVIWRMSV